MQPEEFMRRDVVSVGHRSELGEVADRVLSAEERAYVWDMLDAQWGPIGPTGPYWYPLNGKTGIAPGSQIS
jgi:hypothetical protein